MNDLVELLNTIRSCNNCEKFLPLGARPVLRINQKAKILIIGQAPGTKVHATGIPWNDRSGDQLRSWLELDKTTFYDEQKIAIMGMGFCYPGTNKNGGDNPPRPECAPKWHDALLKSLPNLELILLVGGYSQRYYLGKHAKPSVWMTVKSWQEYIVNEVENSTQNDEQCLQNSWSVINKTIGNLNSIYYIPKFFPLPHPSWRNNSRLEKNDWFYKELLPDLRKRVHHILKKGN